MKTDQRAHSISGLALAALAAMMVPAPALGSLQPQSSPRLDLADTAQGTYFGGVISDARGSSRSDVRVSVTKIGPNRVRVTSDYSRMPAFEIRLTRAMETLQAADGGNIVFLLDLSKQPMSLDIHVDDASWSGRRE